VSPAGVVSVVDNTFNEPNGITLSPDETVLYVAAAVAGVVRTFAVASDGSTSGRKDFASVASPDGFAVDCAGDLYVASGSGTMAVYAPSGSKRGSVWVASGLNNLAFGGAEGKTLPTTVGLLSGPFGVHSRLRQPVWRSLRLLRGRPSV
jgi:gluconolactonase